ncbi:MAG: hypothetical protein L0Z46_04530 [Nitrospiraceae bacterium]|nr:hypothetical protein [Nitrospiraceae bacterium]
MQQSAFPTPVSVARAQYARTGALPVSSCFLFLAVLLEPIYVLPSGLPQVSDAFFAGFIATSLFAAGYRPTNHLFLLLLCVFVFWVFSVTTFWAVYLLLPWGMLHALYIIYNAIICWQVAAHTATSDKLLKAVAVAALVSLCVQALLIVALPSESSRATGSANNPNQFAYWALNAMAVSLLASHYWSVFRKWAVLATTAATIVVLHSISKASAAALIMFLAMLSLQSRKGRVLVAVGLLLTPLIILTPSQISISDSDLYNRWRVRILERGEGLNISEMVTHRKYDRLFEHPEYLVLGASAVRPDRPRDKEDKEIHSTFANLAYSYGVIGLLLFLGIVAAAIYGNLHNAVFLLPAFVYGFTHNGIRSTLLWVLIGLLSGLSERLGSLRSVHRAYGTR